MVQSIHLRLSLVGNDIVILDRFIMLSIKQRSFGERCLSIFVVANLT